MSSTRKATGHLRTYNLLATAVEAVMDAEAAMVVGDATLTSVAEVATMAVDVMVVEAAITGAEAAVASASFLEAAVAVEVVAEAIGVG
jgi:hypothetical protein